VSAEQSGQVSADPDPGRAFLTALCDPQRRPISARTAVIVAHPDDESIGCGAQLSRFSDLGVIHVTDGAPPNGVDARRLGFAGPAEYAQARRGELETAMALVGLTPEQLLSLNWPDQEASANIPAIARELARILAGTDVVLTHAFEGGHPDHDSTALAVHAACALLGRDGHAPAIVEMPLYRTGPEGMAAQSFAPVEDGAECLIQLDWEQQRLKQAMYAAHASQHDVLLLFGVDTERFRAAPSYDFSQPPNGGLVYYDGRPWSMTSERWHGLAAGALAELGMGPVL
jgi:LmbE family N-acetylglucosaminyl deacetylase